MFFFFELTLFYFPQAKANGLQSCVIIIRVMRDLCQRIPAFSPLNNWVSEQYYTCICHSAQSVFPCCNCACCLVNPEPQKGCMAPLLMLEMNCLQRHKIPCNCDLSDTTELIFTHAWSWQQAFCSIKAVIKWNVAWNNYWSSFAIYQTNWKKFWNSLFWLCVLCKA